MSKCLYVYMSVCQIVCISKCLYVCMSKAVFVVCLQIDLPTTLRCTKKLLTGCVLSVADPQQPLGGVFVVDGLEPVVGCVGVPAGADDVQVVVT